MKYDFINELGYLALATRLKRISEAMVHSGRHMYKSLGMDIEPNWFLIFKLLMKYDQLSVTEMANKLHFSHPSVITMVNKMELNGYLHSIQDKVDTRKRLFSLSDRAIKEIPEFEKIWEAGTIGVQKLFAYDNHFLDLLESLEIQLSQSDFMQRTLNELKKDE
ncbi:MAG: MarR family transcriptional regulator [Cyclobacteriaceae bacterium]